MSNIYGKADRTESLATLGRAREMGINFFDSADVYGFGHNEELLAEGFANCRNEVIIATKFGFLNDGSAITGICGKPEYVHQCCDASLRRLGTDVIDLYYLHRPDPDTPIEETVTAMAELVQAGKVRWLGLSEVDADQLRRACGVHPIAAVQSEYSLWCLDVEHDCLETMRELGVAMVPYSPVGRGFLTGAIRTEEDLPKDDFRRVLPRFQQQNLPTNLRIVEAMQQIASELGATAAQVGLAWLLQQGKDVFPIPGTKQRKWLEQNAAAVNIKLSDEQLSTLRALAKTVAGERYGSMLARLNPKHSTSS